MSYPCSKEILKASFMFGLIRKVVIGSHYPRMRFRDSASTCENWNLVYEVICGVFGYVFPPGQGLPLATMILSNTFYTILLCEL